MSEWTRFGDKPPNARREVWVLHSRKGSKPQVAEKVPGTDPYWRTFWGAITYCRPDDLWCYAEPPPLPGKEGA